MSNSKTKVARVKRLQKLGVVAVSLFVLMFAIAGCGTGEMISEPGMEEDTDTGSGDDTSTTMKEFNECLSENGMVVYGMEWCPACNGLVETLGGSDSAEPVYVECTENEQKCQSEMQGSGVPEVQLDGEMYEGQRSLEGFSQATGCELPE
ncbi:MAG: hypothetical protein ACOCQG_06375 [Candidatus Nanoarchaeia archaeon]